MQNIQAMQNTTTMFPGDPACQLRELKRFRRRREFLEKVFPALCGSPSPNGGLESSGAVAIKREYGGFVKSQEERYLEQQRSEGITHGILPKYFRSHPLFSREELYMPLGYHVGTNGARVVEAIGLPPESDWLDILIIRSLIQNVGELALRHDDDGNLRENSENRITPTGTLLEWILNAVEGVPEKWTDRENDFLAHYRFPPNNTELAVRALSAGVHSVGMELQSVGFYSNSSSGSIPFDDLN